MFRKDFDGQREFGGIPSLLEESHKSMNKNCNMVGEIFLFDPQDARWNWE
jgi:hypothetical protein